MGNIPVQTISIISAGSLNFTSSYLEAYVVFSTELTQFLWILVRMELALVYLEETARERSDILAYRRDEGFT